MLRAKLILDRLDKEGRLLERREQPARSFVKQFIELLYIAHYQTAFGSPYSMTDIRGAEVDISASIFAPMTGTRGSKPTLVFGSPPGSSQNILPGGGGTGTRLYGDILKNVLMGEHLGIQVGGGSTAVTPTDRALETRFGHGVRVADGANASFENYKVNDDTDQECYGDKWAAQSFRPQHQHKLYTVKLLLYREGSPGTVTVDIYVANINLTPIGSALVTGTTDGDTLTEDSGGEWREITFPSQIELIPGMSYAVVVHCVGDASNSVHWCHDATSAKYPRGAYSYSSTGGASWVGAVTTKAYMFEELGRSSGELQYGGCELVDLAFSDPNGEFTIRRYFTNNSGESRTVNEVGIYASGVHLTSLGDAGDIYSFCIAHDIVAPGVAVADSELLRATYVPQITV